MESCEIIDADGHVYEPDAELFDCPGRAYRGKRPCSGSPSGRRSTAFSTVAP
jgi:hypothetical protein